MSDEGKSKLELYNKYLKYKTKYYRQQLNFFIFTNDFEKQNWRNENAQNKAIELEKALGKPTYVCMNNSNMNNSDMNNSNVEYVMWRQDLETQSFKRGFYHGLDMIKVMDSNHRKLHPAVAPSYVIAGKLINVPDILVGPLKFASPTINIEQIYVPIGDNDKYIKEGGKDLKENVDMGNNETKEYNNDTSFKNKMSMVTGSCASVTISAITIMFVENMIKEHGDKNISEVNEKLYQAFRDKYNVALINYFKDKTLNGLWFDGTKFGENTKKKVLFMISTHGTWNTTNEDKKSKLKDLYNDACNEINSKLNSIGPNSELYIGYDGDGVDGNKLVPPTILLCMIVNKFKDMNPKVIQCQGVKPDWGLPQTYLPILKNLKELIDYIGEDISSVENQFNDNINKNITIGYKEKNNNHSHPIDDENFGNYIKIDLDTVNGAENEEFGGIVNGELAGSTAGWNKFLSDKAQFNNVYYVPVWDNSLVKENKNGVKSFYKNDIKNSITKSIEDACNKNLFTNNGAKIDVINVVKEDKE